MNNLNSALVAALDRAAIDSDKWVAGKAAFNYALSHGADIDAALVAALDAAANERHSWLAGYEAFWASYSHDTQQATYVPSWGWVAAFLIGLLVFLFNDWAARPWYAALVAITWALIALAITWGVNRLIANRNRS